MFISTYVELRLYPVTASALAARAMDTINFTCNISGFPFTSIQSQWELATPTVNDRIDINTVTNDTHGYIISTFSIKLFQLSDAGLYRCTASLQGLVGYVTFNLTAGMYICMYHYYYITLNTSKAIYNSIITYIHANICTNMHMYVHCTPHTRSNKSI